ncbi:MAG: PaaI family thioesterase [Candidatus Thorarchaeota archaeon]|nr:PaaI family thioesterase [Candidatus Thorarchaeota archaeon]
MAGIPIQEFWPESATFCWGCGKNNRHGLQLKSYWDADETVATWHPQDYHLAFPGVLNGGIIATLIDCHGTGTANAAAHREAGGHPSQLIHVTSSLSVKYLRPTPMDAPVTLRARIREKDGRRTVVDCELYSGSLLCAVGEVRTVCVDAEKFLGS